MHCLPQTKHDSMLCSTAVNEAVYEQPWIKTQVVPGVQSVITGEGPAVVCVEQPELSGGTGEAVDATSSEGPAVGVEQQPFGGTGEAAGAPSNVNPRKVWFAFVKSGRSQVPGLNLYGDAQCAKQW